MRVLLFDTNVVYAKRVGRMLEQYVPGVQIDYARELAVLKDRLSRARYDLVMADIETTLDADKTLQHLSEHADCPVVLWTTTYKNSPANLRCLFDTASGDFPAIGSSQTVRVKKPDLPDELAPVLAGVSGGRAAEAARPCTEM